MSKNIEPIWLRSTAFCPGCQEALSIEEIDFEFCGCCGGEGLGGDDDDFGPWDGDDQ